MKDIFQVTKNDFLLAVDRMLEEKQIFGVQRKYPNYIFENLRAADALCLDYDIALLPPDKYFLPPKELLIEFDLVGKTAGITEFKDGESVILGIHPYDLHALKILDAVYAGYSGSVIDTHYLTRRKMTAIIGVDCLNPWPYSFSASIGTHIPPLLFDLWLTDLGDEYFIEVGSRRGACLLRRYFEREDASEAAVTRRTELREGALKLYQLSLDVSLAEIPDILDRAWDNPVWSELGQKCFSCGACTMVCPTCVCYDVKDRVTLDLQKGERYRQWDSCMLDSFTVVAGGENFRPTGTDRLRHRLYRKGKYMLERWGEPGCVGCGRCVHACLVNIASPVYVYNLLAKEVVK